MFVPRTNHVPYRESLFHSERMLVHYRAFVWAYPPLSRPLVAHRFLSLLCRDLFCRVLLCASSFALSGVAQVRPVLCIAQSLAPMTSCIMTSLWRTLVYHVLLYHVLFPCNRCMSSSCITSSFPRNRYMSSSCITSSFPCNRYMSSCTPSSFSCNRRMTCSVCALRLAPVPRPLNKGTHALPRLIPAAVRCMARRTSPGIALRTVCSTAQCRHLCHVLLPSHALHPMPDCSAQCRHLRPDVAAWHARMAGYRN